MKYIKTFNETITYGITTPFRKLMYHTFETGSVNDIESFLLDNKVELDRDGGILLRWAVKLNKLDVVKLLIGMGADPCIDNYTIFELASQHNRDKILYYLLSTLDENKRKLALDVSSKSGPVRSSKRRHV